MIPLAYNVQNLLVRRGTTLAAAGGIALVVFVLAAAMMLDQGIRKTMGSAGAADKAIVLGKGSDAELASSIETPTQSIIVSAPGVAQVDGRPDAVGEVVIVIALEKVGAAPGQVSNVMVRGVPDNGLAFHREVKISRGRSPTPGTDEVMIGDRIEGRFEGLSIGQSIELKKNRPVQVVGTFTAGGSSYESEIWGNVEQVRTAFGRDNVVSSVTVRLTSASAYASFADALRTDQRLGVDVMREKDYYEKAGADTAAFMKAMGILIAVFFAICAMLGAMITMHGAVAQRQREIGTLRALGFSRGAVLRSFVLESLLVSLVGGALGCAAALLLGAVKFSMMNFATWSEVVFSFSPTGGILFWALFMGLIMGLIGGFLPALRAARVTPTQAMRG